MGKPLKNHLIKNSHADEISNESGNAAFSQVMDVRLSRRAMLQSSGALGVAAALPLGVLGLANPAQAAVLGSDMPRARSLGFRPVPFSTEDKVVVPEGYSARAFYKWGDPVGIAGNMPAFKQDGSNTTIEQAAQAGMHHDGMAYFPVPLGSQASNHGLLAMNHEYIDNGLLFKDGSANWDLNKARKGQNAMGVSIVEVKNHLALLGNLFHHFDSSDYFSGEPKAQLNCLNLASEFVLQSKKFETRFMALVKRLKAAYDVCCGSENLTQDDRDYIHFYLAVRSIVFKLTKGDAPDVTQMNARVRELIAEALKSDGVEEIYALGDDQADSIDIFDEDYLARISKIKLPNTKIQLLQKLLAKAISDFKKVNQMQGIDFSKRFQALVENYNERKENDLFNGEEFTVIADDMVEQILGMFNELKSEMTSFEAMGIDMEEKAFYDILAAMQQKYDFTYDDDKMLELAKEMKIIVDNQAQYPDWSHRDDIKAALKVELILLLHRYGFPPVANDDVYKNVLEQAENFKKNAE